MSSGSHGEISRAKPERCRPITAGTTTTGKPIFVIDGSRFVDFEGANIGNNDVKDDLSIPFPKACLHEQTSLRTLPNESVDKPLLRHSHPNTLPPVLLAEQAHTTAAMRYLVKTESTIRPEAGSSSQV